MTQTIEQSAAPVDAELTPYLERIRVFRQDREPAILVEVNDSEDTPLAAYEQLRPSTGERVQSDSGDVALYPLDLLVDLDTSMSIVVIDLDLADEDAESRTIADLLAGDPVTVLYLHDGEVLDVVLGAASADGMLAAALTLRFTDAEKSLILDAELVYIHCGDAIVTAWANGHAELLP